MTGRAVLTVPVGRAPGGGVAGRSSVISWRGVVPYGRSHGRLPAPGMRIEPGINVGITPEASNRDRR